MNTAHDIRFSGRACRPRSSGADNVVFVYFSSLQNDPRESIAIRESIFVSVVLECSVPPTTKKWKKKITQLLCWRMRPAYFSIFYLFFFIVIDKSPKQTPAINELIQRALPWSCSQLWRVPLCNLIHCHQKTIANTEKSQTRGWLVHWVTYSLITTNTRQLFVLIARQTSKAKEPPPSMLSGACPTWSRRPEKYAAELFFDLFCFLFFFGFSK